MAIFGFICAFFFLFFAICLSIHCGIWEEPLKGWHATILLLLAIIWLFTIGSYLPRTTTTHSVTTATKIVYENNIPVDTIHYKQIDYGH